MTPDGETLDTADETCRECEKVVDPKYPRSNSDARETMIK